MKKRLVLFQAFVAVIMVCTSVYAVINATLELKVTNSDVDQGDTVKVTLALKNITGTATGITNISGYINYNKNVFETVTMNNVVKENNGKVKIGNFEIPIYNGENTNGDECIIFNENPVSENDIRILVDFANNHAITQNTDILTIEFKVKQSATLGNIQEAIKYEMFVLTADGQNLSEVSETIDVTITQQEDNNTNTNNTNSNNTNTNNTNSNNTNTNNANSNNTNTNNTNSNNTNTNNTNSNNTNTNNTNSNNTNTNNTNSNNTNTNVDNTVKGDKLPATGIKTAMIPMIICGIIAYISYRRYIKYKGI